MSRIDGRPGAVLVAWLLGSAVAAAETPLATVAGGADGSGHNYLWVITNHHTSPIVRVEIPHYRADTFFPPAGWKQECTHLMIAGQPRGSGVCRAWVESAADGIAPSRSAEFGLRVAREGAQRRPGNVRVRFADGTEYVVAGVEVPARESVQERFVALIGTALIVAALVWVQMRSRRRTAAATGGQAADPGQVQADRSARKSDRC